MELLNTLVAIYETSRGWNAVILALLSFLLYAVVSNLVHLPTVSQRLRSFAAGKGALPKSIVGAIVELIRFGYYVGVPFLALYFGWIDRRVMGLGLLDWATGLQWAIVLLLASWLILMVIWLPYLRATSAVLAPEGTHRSFPRRVVEIIYMQFHWAFYRAAAITLLTGIVPDEGYWGVAIGLALIFLEALTNPVNRSRLNRIGQADSVVWNSGQAVINGLGFLVTGNFYLLVFIHFLLKVSVPHLRPSPVERPSPFAATINRRRVRE